MTFFCPLYQLQCSLDHDFLIQFNICTPFVSLHAFNINLTACGSGFRLILFLDTTSILIGRNRKQLLSPATGVPNRHAADGPQRHTPAISGDDGQTGGKRKKGDLSELFSLRPCQFSARTPPLLVPTYRVPAWYSCGGIRIPLQSFSIGLPTFGSSSSTTRMSLWPPSRTKRRPGSFFSTSRALCSTSITTGLWKTALWQNLPRTIRRSIRPSWRTSIQKKRRRK